MTIDDLYENCKERLKALGIELQGRHSGGFDGHYNGKHILRVKKGQQGLIIDVKKADDSWRGWESTNDKAETLDKVLDDYIKPKIEIDKARNSITEIENMVQKISNILKFVYPPNKQILIAYEKELEDTLQTLKVHINTLK